LRYIGSLTDFEIEQIVFIIKVLNLSIRFPNNKYPLNNKNYLMCLLMGRRLVLGGRDYSKSEIDV